MLLRESLVAIRRFNQHRWRQPGDEALDWDAGVFAKLFDCNDRILLQVCIELFYAVDVPRFKLLDLSKADPRQVTQSGVFLDGLFYCGRLAHGFLG